MIFPAEIAPGRDRVCRLEPAPLAGADEITGPGTVRLERLLPGTPDRFRAYLTDPELRVTWFAGGPIDLRVGGVADFRYDHARISTEPERLEGRAPPPFRATHDLLERRYAGLRP